LIFKGEKKSSARLPSEEK